MVTAVDGEDGATRLTGPPVDLVLTDVEMPGMDGFSLTRAVRQTPGWADVPVVIMHRDQAYLCRWLGLKELAAIEPKPGVPPSAGYLGQLVTRLSASPPKMILINAYNDPKAAKWLSERVHAPTVVLPYSVGGTPAAKDLVGLFEDTLDRLLGAGK